MTDKTRAIRLDLDALDLAGVGGDRGVLIVSGVGDMDALRHQIKAIGAEIDLICLADKTERQDYVIKDILTPMEVMEIKKTKRERPAHERIAAQKRK